MVDQDHQLCVSKRSFVVGTYACPQQLGTRIFEFLNAFAGAVILNRTLIWHYCDRDSCRFAKQLERCDEMIERKHWMASAEEVTRSLSRGGCPKAGGYTPRTLKDDRRRLAVANKNNIHLNRLRSSQTPPAQPSPHLLRPLFRRRHPTVKRLRHWTVLRQRWRSKYCHRHQNYPKGPPVDPRHIMI